MQQMISLGQDALELVLQKFAGRDSRRSQLDELRRKSISQHLLSVVSPETINQPRSGEKRLRIAVAKKSVVVRRQGPSHLFCQRQPAIQIPRQLSHAALL